jgi:hypothetical protein
MVLDKRVAANITLTTAKDRSAKPRTMMVMPPEAAMPISKAL